MNKNQSSWPRVDSYNRISSWPAPLMPGKVQKWTAKPNTYNEAEQLLSEAVAWWDADKSGYNSGDRWLRNLGTGGEVLDLRLGSSTAPNSNDPKFLAPEESGYVYIPGVVGNYLSVPDQPSQQILGDIDVRINIAMENWTPSSSQDLVTDWGARWWWRINTTGTLSLYVIDSALTQRIYSTSGSGLGFAPGIQIWLRFTIDMDNGAGGSTVSMYTSSDGINWSSLALSSPTQSSTGIMASGISQIKIGTRDGTNGISTAKIYQTIIKNGIDGTTVLDINCNAITDGSATQFSAGTGQIVSINRSSTGRKSVAMPAKKYGTRSCFLFGSDDYMEVVDNWQHQLLNFGRDDSFTVLAVCRNWATMGIASYMLLSKDGANTGNLWFMAAPDAFFRAISGGTTTDYSGALSTALGNRSLLAVSRTPQAVTRRRDAESVTTTASPVDVRNNVALRIGRGNVTYPSRYLDGEVTAAAIFRRALTQQEIQLITNYYQNPQYFYAPSKTDQKTYLSNQLGIDPVSGSAVLDVLSDAVFYIDSRKAVSGERYAKNLGLRGDALNVRYGSSQTANSNDPLLLTPDNKGYVYIPGVGTGANCLTCNPPQVVGDIDIRIKIGKYTDTSYRTFYSVSDFTPNFDISFLNSGSTNMLLIWNENGTSRQADFGSRRADIVSLLTTNSTIWVRATLDVDNGAGQYEAKMWLSPDGITWTQSGTTVTGTTGPTYITYRTGSYLARMGGTPNRGWDLDGAIYRVQVLDGIGGTTVLDIDCDAITSGSQTSFLATTGQVVTVNRSASGRKTVLIPNTTIKEWDQGHMYLPGVSGNYASTPDASALDITGDIDIRARIALNSWVPGTIQSIVSKWDTGNNYSYYFYVTATGYLALESTAIGYGTARAATSSVTVGATAGRAIWVRSTRSSATGDTIFYTSNDGTAWVQLGTTQSTTAGNIYSGSAVLRVGSTDTTNVNSLLGKVYNIQIYNGIAGTKVLDIDFNDADASFVAGSASSFVCSTGQTVTLNSTTNSGMVVRDNRSAAGTPVWLFGTDDYMSVDSPLQHDSLNLITGAPMSMFVVARNWNTQGSGIYWLEKRTSDSGLIGWALRAPGSGTTVNSVWDDGPNAIGIDSGKWLFGEIMFGAAILDTPNGLIYNYCNQYSSIVGTSNTLGSTANIISLQIGRSIAPIYSDTEIIAVAIFKRALTSSEINTLKSFYSTTT